MLVKLRNCHPRLSKWSDGLLRKKTHDLLWLTKKMCDLSEWKQNFNSALVFLHSINDKFFRKIFERERETYYLCLLLLNGRGKCACRTNYKTTVRWYMEYRSLIDKTTCTRLSRMRGKLKLEWSWSETCKAPPK